jgi:hypothetical protein
MGIPRVVARISTAGAALAATTFTVTSCTVPAHGLTGVMIAPNGGLTAVVGWCPGHAIDGLVLYTQDRNRPSVSVGRWSAVRKLSGDYAEVSLIPEPLDWKVRKPLPPALEPQRTYVLYGGTHDNSTSTTHVQFTMATLRALPRGTIVTQGVYDKKTDSWPDVHLDRAGFQRQVHLRYDC